MSNKKEDATTAKNESAKGATIGKPNEKSANAAENVLQSEKPEVSSVMVLPGGKVLSFPQRLEKLNELNAINERYQSLKVSRDKLSKFKLSSDRNLDKLGIKDGFGNVFETSNTVIVKSCIELIMNDVSMKISETEAQLIF